MDGRITYMSDRTSSHVRISSDCGDEDPIHMSQILTAESLEILFDSLAQLSSNNGQNIYFSTSAPVREVFYHDISGYPVAGYLRCSKVIRKNPEELGNLGEMDVHEPIVQGPLKKSKRSQNDPHYRNDALEDDDMDESTGSALLTSLSQGCHPSLADFSSSTGYRYKEADVGDGNASYAGVKRGNTASRDLNSLHCTGFEDGEEIVCVIRPADVAFPQSLQQIQLLSPLSTASMVAHEREFRSALQAQGNGLDNGNRNGHFSNMQYQNVPHYPNKSSNDSSDSNCNSNKNSTSSEAGSDDNGDNGNNSA